MSESNSCNWHLDDQTDSEYWETSCGNAYCFIEGGPSGNKMKFCYYRGKPLIETRNVKEEEV